MSLELGTDTTPTLDSSPYVSTCLRFPASKLHCLLYYIYRRSTMQTYSTPQRQHCQSEHHAQATGVATKVPSLVPGIKPKGTHTQASVSNSLCSARCQHITLQQQLAQLAA